MMHLIDVNDPKLKLERGDGNGPIRFLATAEGYVMCHRPGGMPWVERLNQWVTRPLETDAAPAREQYNKAFGRSLENNVPAPPMPEPNPLSKEKR